MFIKVFERFEKLLEYLIALMVTSFISVTLIQVVFRYIFQSSLLWTGELARYLFVWCVLITSGLALKKGVHIGFDLLINKLRYSIRKWILFVNYLIIIFFSGYVVFKGLQLTISVSNSISPGLGISLAWAYVSIPVGAFIILIFAIGELVKVSLSTEDPEDQVNNPAEKGVS